MQDERQSASIFYWVYHWVSTQMDKPGSPPQETSRGNPYQIHKQPQLAPLDKEWLYSKPLLDA